MARPKPRSPDRLGAVPTESAGPRLRLVVARRIRRRLSTLPRAWRRRLLSASLAAGAALAALAALHFAFSAGPLAGWLDGKARGALAMRLPGAEVRGHARLGWFGAVVLSDLRVPNPGGGVPIVSAEEVVARPSIGALLLGRLRVASVSLRWVRLHPGPGGKGLRALLSRPHGSRRAAAGGAASAAPEVHVRDLYVDLPSDAALGVTTLGPLSLDAGWRREGSVTRFTAGGGLLEGRAGRFSIDGQVDGRDGTAAVRAKLAGLRLADLPPGWFPRLPAALDGAVEGGLSLSRGADGTLSGDARLEARDVSIDWPRLSAEPVRGLSFSFQGPWRFVPRSRTFEMRAGRIGACGNDMSLDVRFSLARPGPFAVELHTGGLDLQKAIDALPPAFRPPPAAPRVEGMLRADLALSGALGRGIGGVSIDKAEIDLSGLRQAARRDLDADYLKRPFRYTPRDAEGPHKSFVVGPENPHFVAYASLPAYVPRAILASEDAGFFGHRGFDFDEIKDSIARDVRSGEAVRGGSTVTQQLVKNLFLTHSKTLSRKIQEALVTLQIEATLPKWRILELYLNTIEWGPEIYGLGEVASRCFGVPAAQLAPKEAALLATLIPSPKRFFHLYCEAGAVTPHEMEHVDRLLGLLHGNGVLDDAAYVAAMASPLRFHHGRAPGPVPAAPTAPAARPSPPPPAPRKKSFWQRLFGG